ncbi:MAG: rhodanese-like domain-containing protein [Verrucomicrobiae bacterium]|nr:rhodanese-like domain-containing protein [Verrucomicrobiae bacterium]
MNPAWRRLWAETLGMIVMATAMGLAFNAFSPAGIAVTRPLPLTDLDPRYLTATETRARYDAGQTVFLDGRSRKEFAAGHIAGALNLPAEKFESEFVELMRQFPLGKEMDLIVYCRGMGCGEGRAVADKLRALGYTRVKIFAGGWKEWKALGWPVEK